MPIIQLKLVRGPRAFVKISSRVGIQVTPYSFILTDTTEWLKCQNEEWFDLKTEVTSDIVEILEV